MPRTIRKDVAAEADLREIWHYTRQTWSEQQATTYLRTLMRGFETIAGDPERGRRRDELRPDYWSVTIEHHVIFYTFDDREVRIRRVLHEVRDFGRHLDDDT